MYGKNKSCRTQVTPMKKQPQLTLDVLRGMMDVHYTLAWTDCRDNLRGNLDLVRRCLKEGSADPLREAVSEWYSDIRAEAVSEILEKLETICVERGFPQADVRYFFETHEEELRDEIYSRDESDPLGELLDNTDAIPVRVEMLSNFDCINSHWLESSDGYSYEDSYFGDMIDALNLDPSRVKKTLEAYGEKCCGHFPRKPWRRGREQVAYELFCQELINSSCGANLLTYIATVDLKALYDADFHPRKIIIPQGNACGIFSSMQGGGSVLEMKLLRDVELKLGVKDYSGFRFCIDSESTTCDYAIRDVYALCDSFFGGKLRVVPDTCRRKAA